MSITDTQSYSLVIRDMLFAAVLRKPFFADFNARKSKMLQIQPENIPYLGIYIIDEQMQPDGDWNAGHIKFTHALRLGFSVIVLNNDPPACEEMLDQAFWAIMNGLWRDPYLTNLLDTRSYPGGIGNPDNTRIEGVQRGTRRHLYGTAGGTNELPIGELQYEATVFYRSEFAPVITDDFEELRIRTGIKIGESEEDMAKRQQVEARYIYQTEGE